MDAIDNFYRTDKKSSASGLISEENKHLIIMCGLPGSGKTSIANVIKNNFPNSVILNRFAFFSRFLNHQIRISRTSLVALVDELFYAKAEELLTKHALLIFDGTYHTRCKRERAYKFAKDNKLSITIIRCLCDNSQILQRLRRQVKKGSKRFIGCDPHQLIRKYREEFEEIEPYEEFHYYFIYNTSSHDCTFQPRVLASDYPKHILKVKTILSVFRRPF